MSVIVPDFPCPNPECQKPLLIENKNDVVDYLCEHCEMRGNPRHYLQLNYAFNKWPVSNENIQMLITIAYVSHRLIQVA